MKHILLIAFILLVITAVNPLNAQERGFGMGIILGEPTGISAKYWTGRLTAFDYALGYSFTSSKSRLHIYIDYLFHDTELIKSNENFILYYGPGVRIKSRENDDSFVGIRGVGGVIWIPNKASFDLFFELAPILNVIPETSLDLASGLGIRYYFN